MDIPIEAIAKATEEVAKTTGKESIWSKVQVVSWPNSLESHLLSGSAYRLTI